MGFAPFHLAKKGLAITLLLTAIVIGPLYFDFVDLVEQGEIQDELPTGPIELSGKPVQLRIVEISTGPPPRVRVILNSPQPLDVSDVDTLKQLISERVGREVVVEAQLELWR